MLSNGAFSKTLAVLTRLLLASTVCAFVYGSLHVYQTSQWSSINRHIFRNPPASRMNETSPRPAVTPHNEVNGSHKVIGGTPTWLASPIPTKVAYMGARPHADTIANLTRVIQKCSGSPVDEATVCRIQDCMDYLASFESDYYFLPPSSSIRASRQNPKKAEYWNSDGKNNTLDRYEPAKSATETSPGSCGGPIIPYHVYWAGPATWRLELFVKSYLYTQNVPCSRLWLWLDADRDNNAVEDMLHSDPIFERLLPLVNRGDILVKPWTLPSRVKLPENTFDDGRLRYYKTPGGLNARGETPVGDWIVRDEEGQDWLEVPVVEKSIFSTAVSDAVRFFVLHLYGGVYLDMDVLLLRDMRPLLLPDPETGKHAFAERWGAIDHRWGSDMKQGGYNTAIISLTRMSSFSSYLLWGGIRMGVNFHPLMIGRMLWKDARRGAAKSPAIELPMLEDAAFDAVWTEFEHKRVGRCTIPCLSVWLDVFQATIKNPEKEWESYEGATKVEVRSK